MCHRPAFVLAGRDEPNAMLRRFPNWRLRNLERTFRMKSECLAKRLLTLGLIAYSERFRLGQVGDRTRPR